MIYQLNITPKHPLDLVGLMVLMSHIPKLVFFSFPFFFLSLFILRVGGRDRGREREFQAGSNCQHMA